MIDMSKIRVGDTLTVRGEVAVVHPDDTTKPVRLLGGSWIDVADIIEHHPKPRPFIKGDPVLYVGRPAKFLAQEGEFAWVEWRKRENRSLSEGLGTVPIAMLEHANDAK